MANAFRVFVGKILGEFGPEGRWHFPGFSNACRRGNQRRCCWICVARIARYQAKVREEIRRRQEKDHREERDNQFVSIDVEDPASNDGDAGGQQGVETGEGDR